MNLDAEYFLRELPANSILNGKFQIQDGIGPEDAIAVVMSETSNSEDQGMTYSLQCMISQDVEVKEGQLATSRTRTDRIRRANSTKEERRKNLTSSL